MGQGNKRRRGGLHWILAYLSASPSSWKNLQSTRSVINKPKEHILPTLILDMVGVEDYSHFTKIF